MLGGGQLGRMWTMAARSAGYRVLVVDPDAGSPAGALADRHLALDYLDPLALEALAGCAAVSTEFENVPADALAWLEQRTRVTPSADCVAIAQDRIREKTALTGLGFETAPFAAVTGAAALAEAARKIGFPAILKAARFGYDGKGQARVTSLAELESAWQAMGQSACVLEGLVALQCEVSVVVARGSDGEVAPFAVAENQHRDGILDVSLVPARVAPELAQQAKTLAALLAERLGYVGVLGVEFFVTAGRLLINEMAPRPHNSGHYTLDACLTSQFEQQLRAMCGLPLGNPELLRPAAMVNLLGDLWQPSEPDWAVVLQHPSTKLHLYGKSSARPGRKMGHFTVLGDSVEPVLAEALNMQQRLRP